MTIDHPHQWFGGRTYAQHGDDLVVLNVFHRLGVYKPSYLTIGAYHPFDLSNTALLYQRGSRGIVVEANPDLIAAFHEHRSEDTILNVAVAERPGIATLYRAGIDCGRNSIVKETMADLTIVDSVEVEAVTVNGIVDRYAGGVFPDFLNIDIEGADEAVLRSCSFARSAPMVICAEAVAGPHDAGNEIETLMLRRGFGCVFRPGSNMILVRNDLRRRLGY